MISEGSSKKAVVGVNGLSMVSTFLFFYSFAAALSKCLESMAKELNRVKGHITAPFPLLACRCADTPLFWVDSGCPCDSQDSNKVIQACALGTILKAASES